MSMHAVQDAPGTSPRVSPRHDIGVDPYVPTLFAVVALCCTFLLAYMVGRRATAYRRVVVNKFAHILVHIQAIVGVCFVTSSTIIVVLQMRTPAECHAAIYICLVNYILAKWILYLFLLERAHIVRAPFVKNRLSDRIWIVGIVAVSAGYAAICIYCLLTPQSGIGADGRCRIGTSIVGVSMLLGFDVLINLSLTSLFIILLRPALQVRQRGILHLDEGEVRNGLRKSFSKFILFGAEERETSNMDFWISIKALLWRNALGSALTLVATIANITIFLIDSTLQLGWICLITCMLDVTWGILVVYWITIGSCQTEHDMARQTLARSGATGTRIDTSILTPGITLSRTSSMLKVQYADKCTG